MMTCNLSPALSPPRIRVNLFRTQQSPQIPSFQTQGRRSGVTVLRLTVAAKLNVPKMQLNEVKKKKLIEAIPEPVKQVPWKNAEKVFLNNLLEAGEKALKLVFILSFLSDVIFSVLKNKELFILVGLFVGCVLSDFLNETLRELFSKSEQSNSRRQLLSISRVFVVVRLLCSSLSLPASVLLMHVANGGLMQVLWLCRNSREASRNNSIEEGSVLSLDTS